MTRFKSLLEDFVKKDGPIATYEDNGKGTTKGFGTVKCKSVVFKNKPKVFNKISSQSSNYVTLTMKSILTRRKEK